jgi:hypothetical protein
MTHKLQAEFDAIHVAQVAAALTAKTLIDTNPETWYPCGFAWVIIKPARGPLVEALKILGLGRTSETGGFMVYNPSSNPTQWMDAKEAGARAFKDSLALFLLGQPATYTKYKISLGSRMD